jgi:hypothetical protein
VTGFPRWYLAAGLGVFVLILAAAAAWSAWRNRVDSEPQEQRQYGA